MGKKIVLPLIVIMAAVVVWFASPTRPAGQTLPYSQFLVDVGNGRVASGYFDGDMFFGKEIDDGPRFSVYLGPPDPYRRRALEQALDQESVVYEYRKPLLSENATAVLVSVLLPLMVMIVIWYAIVRQARSLRPASGKLVALTLTEPLAGFVDSRVATGGYASAEEYLRDLIREDERRTGS